MKTTAIGPAHWFEHDLFQKPVPNFRDHALTTSPAAGYRAPARRETGNCPARLPLRQHHMRGGGRRHVLGTLVTKLGQVETPEQVLAGTEQHRRDGEVHLVDETGREILAD